MLLHIQRMNDISFCKKLINGQSNDYRLRPDL